MEYSSRIFVPNISAEYFRRKCNKKRGKSGRLTTLAPHTYTHTTMTNYECILCKKFFVFPSELDAHMVIHDTLPNFSCNIVGCSRTYFRKAKLTAHIKTHDGKIWKCKCKGCKYEAVDKRYLTARKRAHSETLNYFCRHCEEKFEHFKQ